MTNGNILNEAHFTLRERTLGTLKTLGISDNTVTYE